MPLPTPKLDDRTFEQLVAETRARIAGSCPEWTDLGPSDPGTVLLEAFAHLTETLLYRVNRIPEKAYVEFLRLIGVRLQPPAAARARLRFSLDRPAERTLQIPRGYRVAAKRAGAAGVPAVFATADEARIEKGQSSASATAYHCDLVEAEVVGKGTGHPGLTVSVLHPPIVAPTGDALDLVVGVEATKEEVPAGTASRQHGDRIYRIWREVESFAHAELDPHVYVADRLAGAITFAPSVSLTDEQGRLDPVPRAHAAVPKVGREIRVWYRGGGGPEGNLPAGALEVLKDPIPGLKVTNPEPATGGRAAETLANALVRGPEEIHSLRRAVTASDFEEITRRSASGIARSRAVTQAEVWRHAPPGTVEVLLVPELPPEVRQANDEGVTAEALREHQTEAARARIQAELDARRPMGTRCVVSWARTKTVAVKARLLAYRTADPVAIRSSILRRLYRHVDPLPADDGKGWPFGDPLARSSIYFILQSEPGVVRVEELRLAVEDAPARGVALAADAVQSSTWYAADGEVLYRSMNDGDGWEAVGRFPAEELTRVAPHPSRAGLLAVAARLTPGDDRSESRIHVSFDCGETWSQATHTTPSVSDLAWTVRDGVPILFVATSEGLFELAMKEGATPLPIAVDSSRQKLGFWSLVSAQDARGNWAVAAAAKEASGVWLSESGGASQTFKSLGLDGEDVRVLEVQQEGPRSFLWAGFMAPSGSEQGRGCQVWELTGKGGWRTAGQEWDGGSCLALAFDGSRVFAGTHRAGVLWLDWSLDQPTWTRPDPSCGLPLREKEKLFLPVLALAARGGLVLAGGERGVFRAADPRGWESCSQREIGKDVLPLPPTWLFCSGRHEIEVKLT